MKLQNLVKSWGILAPDEVFCQDELELVLLKNPENLWRVSIDPNEYHPYHHVDALQGYLQRRILERNWRAELHFSGDGSTVSSAATIEIDNLILSSEDLKRLKGQLYRQYWSQSSHPSILEALLTTYVTALAMERPITPGKWTHFKGLTVDVVAGANFVKSSSGKFVGTFVLEDRPESEASLFALEDDTYEFTIDTLGLARLSKGCPFTFYLEGDRKWARKSEVFLELVDGNLRFTKATEA